MQGKKRKTGPVLLGWWLDDDDKDGRCVWSDEVFVQIVQALD